MKTSQLIEALQTAQARFGDLDVEICDSKTGDVILANTIAVLADEVDVPISVLITDVVDFGLGNDNKVRESMQ